MSLLLSLSLLQKVTEKAVSMLAHIGFGSIVVSKNLCQLLVYLLATQSTGENGAVWSEEDDMWNATICICVSHALHHV